MIHNLTKKTVIARKSFVAMTFHDRARGLIGRDFQNFDAMVFNNCSSIHTMFMSMGIDVLFVDRNNKICGLRRNLSPWIPFVRSPGAFCVIELPAGTVERSNTEKGDVIDLNAELTEKAMQVLVGKEIVAPQIAASLKGTKT
ncbi:MAG: DUF192 domain-containing protein [Lentisphaerae bacterium]|nr:DUF192 domain-containing protein [Lentisphaerota bacterium]